MGFRTFRLAASDNSVSGETYKPGGGSGDNLIYQTTQGTPPETITQGANIGCVMGPQETSMCIAAYAHRDLNSVGANGVTYDVTFYGGSTATEAAQLAAINGAVAQANADGQDTSALGYPYTSDVAGAGSEVNGDSEVSIIVIQDNTVL